MGDIRDNDNDIKSSTKTNLKKEADQMAKNEEKVVSEKMIIKKEKKQIKAANQALVAAQKKLRLKPTNIVVKKKKKKSKKKLDNSMKTMSCFYIVFSKKGPNGEQLALEVAQEDKYHPKKTGVYNVDLQNFMGNLPAKDDKEHHKKA